MISEKHLAEIREWLQKSQNPVFFFDNDVDGLTSFLLFRRFINTGKGVVVKTSPLTDSYARKLHELKPDVVFILDVPVVEKSFLDECKKMGMPVVRIDHHPVEETSIKDENCSYYNPLLGKDKTSEPVSYWCYRVVKKDEWIAMLGCIADWYLPDFAKEFEKEYSDIFVFNKDPEEILFGTEFGKLVRMLSFALKDTTTNVIKMMKVLCEAKNPYEILHGDKKFERINERYLEIKKKYDNLLEKINKDAGKEDKKWVYFEYVCDMGMSAELSNEIFHLFKKKKAIVIVRVIDSETRVSIRTRDNLDAREFVKKALENTGGTGGGHKYACGAKISIDKLPIFKKNIEDILK